jgi:hypothetical protein
VLDINDLWDSCDEREWLASLGGSWQIRVGRNDPELAKSVQTVDLEFVRRLGIQEWYEFLSRYFQLQFAGKHLQQKLKQLDSSSFEHLFSVKCNLVATNESDLADTRKCLNLVRSPRIRGLDYPGASGLLALLFQEWFGAANTRVLSSLCKIDSLPEKRKMREVCRWVTKKHDWRESDTTLLIDTLRRKAAPLNVKFGTSKWTPNNISMILSAFDTRPKCRISCEESAVPAPLSKL